MTEPLSTAGTLFVVATPIGNLSDLTIRAVETLLAVPLVAAEDTRRSRKLLQHVGSGAGCLSFHAQSPVRRLEEILERLTTGDDVALLTDAGTPTISDPGGQLVAAHRARGGLVVPIPGPSAVATALSVSGLPADRYIFLGFLPRKGRARKDLIGVIAGSPQTVVLFEAPGRLASLLSDLGKVCDEDRVVVVARELTKLYEETRSGTLAEMMVYYQDRPLKGEITVVIAPGKPTKERPGPEVLEERARELLEGGSSRRDAASALAAEAGISRNEAYELVTAIK